MVGIRQSGLTGIDRNGILNGSKFDKWLEYFFFVAFSMLCFGVVDLLVGAYGLLFVTGTILMARHYARGIAHGSRKRADI